MFPLFILTLFISVINSQSPGWTASPFNPPSLPLAVKSPYINVWIPQGNNPSPITWEWPQTQALYTMGWNADVRVDGKAYNLMGKPPNLRNFTNANQTSVQLTPSRTSYLLKAGPVDVNMTFFTPIEAQNLTRLSTPFSYLYLTAIPNDNNAHQVQFYSDLSGEWISGDESLNSNYVPQNESDFIYLQMNVDPKQKFQDIAGRAQDSTLYHCMKKRPGISWDIGNADDLRNSFGNGTGLRNDTDKSSHPINSPWDTLGISVDVGSVQPGNESDAVIHAIGVVRDPAIQFTIKNSRQENRRSYYWSNYSSIEEAIEDLLNYFDDALTASVDFDNKLLAEANNISSEYADLISLTTRQAMSAIEYTINSDTSDIKAFLNNTGEIGSGRVNAVEVIYAAMPIYVYLNPNITGYLLSPLLDYQKNLQGTHGAKGYAEIDLGGGFPNATGTTNDTPNEGIEQSANMIILSLIHAKTSGDGTLLSQYYDLLAKWANYLVDNVMSSGASNQETSADGTSSSNQTNLIILKGIIGLQAMSRISSLAGQDSDSARYKSRADEYYNTWESLAIAPSSIVFTSGSSDSGLIYDIYADKILGLNIVNETVYELQTSFYRSQAENNFGIPIDSSDPGTSRSDWMLFAAAAASDPSVRNSMISQVHRYATSNSSKYPFPVRYNPITGSSLSGYDSPAQGAIFAPLALNVESKNVTVPPIPRNSKPASTGTIVGSTVGAVAFVTLLAFFVFIYRRRRQNKSLGIYNKKADRIRHAKPIDHVNSLLQPSHPSISQKAPVPENVDPNENYRYSDIIPVPYTPPMPQENAAPVGGKSALNSVSRGPSVLDSHTTENTSARQDGSSDGEVLREVSNLRMEIERMREENALQNLPPPSYEY